MVIVYLDRIERLAVRREGKQIELVLDFKASPPNSRLGSR